MSTTVRSNSESRSDRIDRPARGVAERAGRGSQRPLTGRALRVRNACVCHAAARLGLMPPSAADLRDLPADASLAEAVEWWRARAPGTVQGAGRRARVSLALKTAVVVGVALVGLAVSYGQAQ